MFLVQFCAFRLRGSEACRGTIMQNNYLLVWSIGATHLWTLVPLYSGPFQVVAQPSLGIRNQSFLVPSASASIFLRCFPHLIGIFDSQQELASSSFGQQVVEQSGT